MASYNDVGRISRGAATGTIIFLYVLAIAAATLRTAIRWHYGQLKAIDDSFLATAVVLMTCAFGLFFGFINDLYITEALIYDPLDTGVLQFDVIAIAIHVQKYTTAYIVLSITGIFAVKASFIAFFHGFIYQLRPLLLHWRVVAVFTALSWVLSVGISFLACPYFDGRALKCAQGPELSKALNSSIILIVFDISTDLLILSIPVIILKKIRVSLKSKVYLGLSLCLSVVMIAVAILQGATLEYAGVSSIDVVWEIYWQFVELTLAVTVVSAAAFRSFFIQRQARSTPSPHAPPSWYSGRNYKFWKRAGSNASPEQQHEPDTESQGPYMHQDPQGEMMERDMQSPVSPMESGILSRMSHDPTPLTLTRENSQVVPRPQPPRASQTNRSSKRYSLRRAIHANFLKASDLRPQSHSNESLNETANES